MEVKHHPVSPHNGDQIMHWIGLGAYETDDITDQNFSLPTFHHIEW